MLPAPNLPCMVVVLLPLIPRGLGASPQSHEQSKSQRGPGLHLLTFFPGRMAVRTAISDSTHTANHMLHTGICIDAQMHAHMHAQVYAYAGICMCACMHEWVYTCTGTCMRACTLTYMHARTHVHTGSHAPHKYACTHHKYARTLSCVHPSRRIHYTN